MNRFFLLLFIIAYFLVADFFAPHPRGSDQYWNIGNVERVVHQDGKYKTNNIFPVGLPSSNTLLPRPWIQNRPIVYIVTAISFLIAGAQTAWVLLNCLFLLVTAWLLLMIFERDPDQNRTLMAVCIAGLLFSPLNFYLSMQALPELFNQFLATAILFALLYAPSKIHNVIAAAVFTGILIFQRDNNVLLIILIPVYLFFFSASRRRVFPILVFIGVSLLFLFSRSYLFPPHSIKPLDFLSIISEVKPGELNMVNYLYTDFQPHTFSQEASIMVQKVLAAFDRQFTLRDNSAIIIYSVNLLLIPFILLLCRYRRLPEVQRRGVFITGIFVLLHIATIVFFENQYRFSSIVLPMLLLCTYWLIRNSIHSRLYSSMFLFAVFLFMLVDVFIGIENQRESRDEHMLVEKIRGLKKNELKDTAAFIQYVNGKSLLVAYSLSPNLCYYFPSDDSVDNIRRVARQLGTNYFFIRKGSSFYQSVSRLIQKEIMVDPGRRLVMVTLSL